MGFEAKYGGGCAGCPERIVPGQLVTFVDDELVHVGCEEGVPPERPAPEVCTECWLEKPCGCGEF